jgi:RimJ/RimL family protein N-acetyltransferase
VADWVGRRIAHVGTGEAFGPCAAIGVEAEDGRPLGGVVFSNWQPACRSIEASFAADGPRWLTRRLIGQILSYPFGQLDCQRITALTPRRATAARRFLEAFGFRREGLVRKGFGDDDAVVSGLLRREWETSRWVRRGDQSRSPSSPRTTTPTPRSGSSG